MVQLNSVPCMNAQDEPFSYANHSLLQKAVIVKAKQVLKETVTSMLTDTNLAATTTLNIADLGCSSGPNTLLVISQIVNTIHQIHLSTQVQVFLNDLPGNDFNSIFKSLHTFYETHIGSVFVSGTPGSFYGRLFPDKSMHFIHSSSSLNWLSKVPELGECNKKSVYLSKLSSKGVFEAYFEQFRTDFMLFLRSRSQEIVDGGRLVLVLTRSSDHHCPHWDWLTKSLLDLVHEGVVEGEKVDSFNLPFYNPSEEEVIEIGKVEGSFKLDKLETFEVNYDSTDDEVKNNIKFVFNENQSGKRVSDCIRAASEPILVPHFGKIVMDALFVKYTDNVTQHLAIEKTTHMDLVVSLTKIN